MKIIILLISIALFSCSEKTTEYHSCNEDGEECYHIATFYGQSSADYCARFNQTYSSNCVWSVTEVHCEKREPVLFPRGLKSYCR